MLDQLVDRIRACSVIVSLFRFYNDVRHLVSGKQLKSILILPTGFYCGKFFSRSILATVSILASRLCFLRIKVWEVGHLLEKSCCQSPPCIFNPFLSIAMHPKANVTLFNIQTVYKRLGEMNCVGLPETSLFYSVNFIAVLTHPKLWI